METEEFISGRELLEDDSSRDRILEVKTEFLSSSISLFKIDSFVVILDGHDIENSCLAFDFTFLFSYFCYLIEYIIFC